jgi:hypothetical protein
MYELAQTNVQLCRQVVALGWDDDELLQLRHAYELAMDLFSGQFRANGKTQLAHHVGVASALALAGERPTVVIAGAVHSAYFLGEFGDGRPGARPDKRPRVTAAVGPDVEVLIDAYTELEWNGDSVRTLIADISTGGPLTRDTIAMRIANEIDERADASQRMSAGGPEAGLDGDDGLALLDELTRIYGLDHLGSQLREAEAHGDAFAVPDVLVSTNRYSTFVAPASYRRRLHIVLQDSRIGHEVAVRVPGARGLAERIRRVVS